MLLTDTVALGDARVTADGYLVADVKAARIGIQVYAGREVGRPEMDEVRVYRPENEVFQRDAMASFSSVPVTLDHPPEMVGPANWKKYAVGFTGESVARDGGFVRVPLAVKDQAAVDAVKAGKRQLSMGYTCDLSFEVGTTPEGEAYDAVQTNIRGNHLAIVAAGRAGPDCTIGDQGSPDRVDDHEPAHRKGQDMTLQKVTVDGITVEMSDTAAQVVSKVQQQVATLTADNLKLVADHAAALKAKDTELAAKDAEIAKLKDAALDDAKLDALVTARADVIGKAKAIVADVKTEGLSIPAIRRATVVAKLGDAAVKDRSDDYVEARFDLLAADVKPGTPDPVRDAIRSGAPTVTDGKSAYDANVAYLESAWKGEQKGAA